MLLAPLRTLFAITALVLPALSQDVTKPAPRNAKKGDFAVFPLGPIGGQAEVLADSAEAKVLSLLPKGPGAKAGLLVGDRIIAAGKRFPAHTRNINVGGEGPMQALGLAIEKAEGKKGVVELTVRREGGAHRLEVTIPAVGKFKRGYPTNCDKSQAFYDGICRDLIETQKKNGSWRASTGTNATLYVTALCGLALLGRGDPSHAPALKLTADFFRGPQGKAQISDDFKTPAGLSNWWICAAGMYLAEYVLATGDERYVPTIQHLVDCMVARQSPAGRYGHGITVGYTGRGFNVINTHSHLLWALAERVGCKVKKAAWDRSFAEIRKSTGDNGGVRYWTSQTGYWDACARTSQMALALDLTKRAPKLKKKMGGYLADNHLRMREAHAMGSIGMLFGTAALCRVNRKGWRKHMDSWRWYLNLMRQPDGSAGYVGGKRNNGGDHYLRKEHVANAVAGVMLATGFGRLHICGNDRKAWLKQ